MVWKGTCSSVLIVALYTVVKTWKQPKCPSTKEWIKKMWYIYTMEYYSVIKKNEIMPFAATWMDLKIIILSEVSQTEKDSYYMIYLICRILKKSYKGTYLQNRSCLFLFALFPLLLETDPKKILLWFMSRSILPMFSSMSFMVSGLTLRYLINFEFLFVYGCEKMF